MILVSFLIVLIALGGAKQEEVIEFTSSGDGESTTLSTASVYLIDENGDIQSGFTSTAEPIVNGTEKSEKELMMDVNMDELNDNKTSTLMDYITNGGMTTTSSSATSTVIPTVVTDTTSSQDATTDTPTNETIIDVDSTTPASSTTVSSSTTSTMVPSTLSDEVSTVTTKQATTFRSTTTAMEKNDKSSDQISRATEETLLPDVERHVCSFLDKDLTCNEDIVCYGEGEIDCTGDDDVTFIDKISLSSISEDYSDYDVSDSGTVGTFPPNLVGVVSPKKIPFLFNVRSFATTDMDINVTAETTQDNSSTVAVETTETTSTLQSIESSTTNDEKKDSVVYTTVAPDTNEEEFSTATPAGTEKVSTLQADETTMDAEERAGNVSDTSNGTTTVEEVDEESSTMDTKMTSTTEVDQKTTKKPSVLRRKREEVISSEPNSSSSSMSMSFHVAALESPKKKLRAKVCRLSGDLVCKPTPTIAMCKGKTFCQATSSTAETAESSSTKGVETWAIIVIVVCALSGCLTVCLLIYLVVTSCKKLKVQPTHEVTTLNYITRGNGATELA